MIVLLILIGLGFVISAYALFVERKIRYDKEYKPMCDINSWASCSKPLKSKYAKLFFVSNALMGVIFYAFAFIFVMASLVTMLFLSSIVACIVSVVLAYVLYFKIKSLCLLCTLLYSINILLLIMSSRLFFS